MNLQEFFENLDAAQQRVRQLPADFRPADTSPQLAGPYPGRNATRGYLVGEDQDMAEGISVTDQQYDLDQMVLTLDIEGRPVQFTYWDYDEDFENAERRDVFDQLQQQSWYSRLDHPTRMEILDAAYRAIRGLEPQPYRPRVDDEPMDEQGVAEGQADSGNPLQRTIDFAVKNGYQVKTSPKRTRATFINRDIDHEIRATLYRMQGDDMIWVNFDDRTSGMSGNDPADTFYDTFVRAYQDAAQDVSAGHADQQRKIFKQNGQPVGEVGIDRESSPGVGQYYMKHYASGTDNSGYDSFEEAVEELRHLVKQGVSERALNELDIMAPRTTYFRMGDGRYVKADYRASGGSDSVPSFVKFQWVDPKTAQQLNLDQILAAPDQASTLANEPGRRQISSPAAYQAGGPLSQRNIDVIDTRNPPEHHSSGLKSKLATWVTQQNKRPGVAEGVEIVDQDSDLDQQVFTLNVDGETVSFTYWDYENNFQNPDIKDIYQQAREQLSKKLSPEQIKAVARSVFKSFKSGVAEAEKKSHPKTWHDVDPKLGKAVDKMSQAEKVKKGYAHPDTLKKKGVAEGILGDREYNRVMPVVQRIASEVSDYDRDEFGEELWSLLDQKYGSKFAQSVLQDSLDFYWDEYTELTGQQGVAEGVYNPLDDERREQRRMDQERAQFKRDELEAELGDEEQRAQQIMRGTWYVIIDGRAWQRQGRPVEFQGKNAARRAGQTIKNRTPERTVTITQTLPTTENAAVAEIEHKLTQQITAEDVLGGMRQRLGDMIQAKAEQRARQMARRQPPQDVLGEPVRRIDLGDGKILDIHGNEDDGFRIYHGTRGMPTRFATLEEAEMATRIYESQRREGFTDEEYAQAMQDYLASGGEIIQEPTRMPRLSTRLRRAGSRHIGKGSETHAGRLAGRGANVAQGNKPVVSVEQQHTAVREKTDPDLRRTARTSRIMQQLRARYPEAQTDLEALLLDFRSGQAQDRSDITRIDGELDTEEAEIDSIQQQIDKLRDRKNTAEGKRDACYHKVKASAKVWPSAYASGRLVQCRKRGAANWGTGGRKKS